MFERIRLPIKKLQPTDFVNLETISFFDSLDNSSYLNLGLPEIWETNKGLYITDGNNRITYLASIGQDDAQVYFSSAIKNEVSWIDELIYYGEQLRKLGIKTVYDFL